jgi:hypothetical protein
MVRVGCAYYVKIRRTLIAAGEHWLIRTPLTFGKEPTMEATTIFKPVTLLALWTLVIVSMVGYRRVKAGLSKQITPQDFKYGESSHVPAEVTIPNRAFMNLLEAPVLFYLATVVIFLTQRVDPMYVKLAWIYLFLRLGHSLVHITYNHVVHRLTLYALSNVTLAAIWLRLCSQLFAG